MLVPEGEDGRMAGNMVRDGGLTMHGPTRCTERKRQIATNQPRQKYLHPRMLEERAHRLAVRALIVNCHYRRVATWPRRRMPAPVGWTQYATGCTPSAPTLDIHLTVDRPIICTATVAPCPMANQPGWSCRPALYARRCLRPLRSARVGEHPPTVECSKQHADAGVLVILSSACLIGGPRARPMYAEYARRELAKLFWQKGGPLGERTKGTRQFRNPV